MKKLLSTILFLLVLFGCKTNPPTDPNVSSVKTGDVLVEITLNQDQNLNAQRTVLLEDFANVSCIPCVQSNKIIESFTRNVYGPTKLTAIKFSFNFPSPNDPFYLAGKEFCDYRIALYGVFFAPTIVIDGILRPPGTDSVAMKQAVDQRLNTAPVFAIASTKQIQNGGLKVEIDITAKDTNSVNLNDLTLRYAVVESEVEFPSPPGSNGEKKFFDVLRVLFPSNEGISLSGFGSSRSFLYEDVLDSTWNINNLKTVTFIQDINTKEILQASTTN